MEYEMQESKDEYTKRLNLNQPKTCMCRYRVNQHLIVPNLYSVSVNKILVTEFINVKVSQKSNFYAKYVNTVK